jgi:lipopolysaccharide/colanic/teichoic acid biosynthesis glycosyltransferase
LGWSEQVTYLQAQEVNVDAHSERGGAISFDNSSSIAGGEALGLGVYIGVPSGTTRPTHRDCEGWSTRRVIDVVVAVLGLLVLGLPMLLIALLIRLDSPGPVFFVQERLGRYRRPFLCIKFRTMRADAERWTGPVWSTRGDQRVTRIGRVLRPARLDELPQLLNILRGEMTLVGPRPIRLHFADLLAEIEPRFNDRFEVKPGLTGWAQICLVYPTTIEAQLEKLEYDLYYIANRSVWLDLRIIVRTFGVVLRRQGV